MSIVSSGPPTFKMLPKFMLEHKEEREEPLFLKGENLNIGKKAIKIKQDLGTVLRCCSFGSFFKMLPCKFFLMGWKCIF